ncbi:MAG TPA: hypothetical protein PKY81_10845 [bacterium]|nr:hypothetical protein [bacterium]HPN31446.1 hypothetical protein [bacterium]
MKKIKNFIAYSPHFYLIYIFIFFAAALVFGISENLNALFLILCVCMTLLIISDSVKFIKVYKLKKRLNMYLEEAGYYLHSNCVLRRKLNSAKNKIKYYESKLPSDFFSSASNKISRESETK